MDSIINRFKDFKSYSYYKKNDTEEQTTVSSELSENQDQPEEPSDNLNESDCSDNLPFVTLNRSNSHFLIYLEFLDVKKLFKAASALRKIEKILEEEGSEENLFFDGDFGYWTLPVRQSTIRFIKTWSEEFNITTKFSISSRKHPIEEDFEIYLVTPNSLY